MVDFLDVCRFTPTAGGTTDWTYSAAASGYQSPTAAGAINGTVYRYRAESADLSQWEIGFGAYNSGTGVLARTTVLFNSLGTTAKVNFSTVPTVGVVFLAEDLTFIQTGTGAVRRPILNKIGETFSVTDFGAIGTADDSSVFTLAINAASAAGGGTINIPAGVFAARGLHLPNGVTLQGAGKNATYLQSWYVDNFVVSIDGTKAGIADLTIYGKGVNGDTGAFGAVNPALYVTGIENNIRRVLIGGGVYPLYITGSDNLFEDVNADAGYGLANWTIIGSANWFIRCKMDNSTVATVATDQPPYTIAWVATTAYTVGKVRVVTVGGVGYAIICAVAGTSGGSAPTLRNYGLNITDGSVTWQLVAPAVFSAVYYGAGSGESHFTQCDLSGHYSSSLRIEATAGSSGPGVVVMTDSVFSSQILITNGALVILHANELGSNIVIDTGYTGRVGIVDNFSFSAVNINVGANVSNLVITGNDLNGGTIAVAAGTSDHYRIRDNPNTTVTDLGTGTDKVVETSSLLSFGSNVTIRAPLTNFPNAVGFGTTNPQTPVEISANATATPAPAVLTDTNLWLIGKDGAFNNSLTFDQYGGGANNGNDLSFRQANGTAAAPTASTSGNTFGQFRFWGHDGSAFYRTAALFVSPNETFSGTAGGADLQWFLTPNTTRALAKAVTFKASGSLVVGGTAVDPGNGGLFAASIGTAVSTTKTSNYSMVQGDGSLIFNGAGSLTLTLLSAASFSGRWLSVKTIAAQTVVSASSNVVPLAGGAAGTAILAATAGKWARLQSDGTNWVIMEGN